jgi:hypothetical protein
MKILEIINHNFMYHNTSIERLGSIRVNGLRLNMRKTLTDLGKWSFKVYRCVPIFLSVLPNYAIQNDFTENAPICLRIDTTNLPLVADLPSLIDTGAYIDLDDEVLWWTEGEEPPDFNGLGEISFYDLIRPNDPISMKAIKLTKTCACIQNIDPIRIEVMN